MMESVAATTCYIQRSGEERWKLARGHERRNKWSYEEDEMRHLMETERS
jgi:hypothetical protein